MAARSRAPIAAFIDQIGVHRAVEAYRWFGMRSSRPRESAGDGHAGLEKRP